MNKTKFSVCLSNKHGVMVFIPHVESRSRLGAYLKAIKYKWSHESVLVDGYYAHRYKLRHWKVARIEEIK